ncbi:MAG: Gfo/Idh/MocA family oxidoreductase [Proteobacteria bacterium]|nr:Gfo/Idh/MocA family oxidoreductase [Pseudomonadota bacterium]
MRSLIIGYGSIGARHARLLAEMGHEVRCVTRNPQCPFPVFTDLADALDGNMPGLTVISTPTADHHDTLRALLAHGFSGRILVEKPLFDHVPATLPPATGHIFAAYNLRLHPLVQEAARLLTDRPIFSARFFVGQYLPDWRPGTDYTAGYSARRDQGGGVLRDLSHELDLALHLLGPWRRVAAIGGHFSDLAIDSDDVFDLLLETSRCPSVSIHLDYLNRTARRGFEINAQELSIHADFITGRLEAEGQAKVFDLDRDATYRAQLAALTSGETARLCSFEQGLAVLGLIEAAERAATQGQWVTA